MCGDCVFEVGIEDRLRVVSKTSLLSFLNVNFAVSVALAQYVIHGNYPQKWFLTSETLDQFRSIILATIRQQGSQDFERFSGIACPMFCLAMLRMLTRTVDAELLAAHHVFVGSPWTRELLAELGKLLSSKAACVGSDPCHGRTVRTPQTLRDIVTLLVQVVS